ncbi:hypothetical protein ACOAKC_12435 [Hathewaya histolytica]|uniref:hypothetical protein n=1 Tax=Hathewaya histolytica TaxID=1498 RepID=UPI003B673A1B
MKSLIKGELFRFFKKKSYMFIIIITLLLMVLSSINFKYGHVAFYNIKGSSNNFNEYIKGDINRLNFSIFMLGELPINLIFIVVPFLAASVLNVEMTEGYLRMIMVRGCSKIKIILSKIISIFIFNMVNLLFMGIISYVISFLLYPHISQFTIPVINKTLNLYQSILYFIKYLGVYFIVCSFLSSIAVLLNMFMPNSMVSMFAFWVLMGMAIFKSGFFYNNIFNLRNYTFQLVNSLNPISSLIDVIVATLIISMISCFVFNKMDYKY